MPAGARVPIRPTIKQEQYCRKAIGINRFCYNLAVATHRFHRVNRLPWPSWQDIYKAFNACKHEDYPFVTEVASRVAEGAFMNFGSAMANWRNPNTRTRAPKFKHEKLTGTGSFRAASGVTQIRYNGKRRIQLPGLGSVKLDCTLPKGIYHEAHIKQENDTGASASNSGEHPSQSRRMTTAEPALWTPASIPWAPTPTARNTRTHRQPTRWRTNSADGREPRPGGKRAPAVGGKPNGR